MSEWTISGLLGVSAGYLSERGSASPRLDAELLLAEVLGLERIDLYTQHDRPLTEAEVAVYRELVARRARHEPVAYILGRAHFRYQTVQVTPDVLIPRPETEELVEVVLGWLRESPLMPPDPGIALPPSPDCARAAVESSAPGIPAAPEASARPRVADVGTGSGAIALSLAAEAGVTVLATDSSALALAVAARNRETLGLATRVCLCEADLLDGVAPDSLRVVVSNPPYVADGEYADLSADVRDFEPAAALRGGPDGLDTYSRLLPRAATVLGPGGALFVEIGATQAAAVSDLARSAGFCRIATLRDLSGKERMVRGVKPGALRLAPDELRGPTTEALRTALRSGAILGVPTDTVYGIAAAWDSFAGVRRLFESKGRGEERPVGVLFCSVASVREALPDLDEPSAGVLEAMLPGPYTFVVGTGVRRPPLVGTGDSLGVRVPDNPALLTVLEALATPLAATSANVSGSAEPATVDQVDPNILAWCCAAIDPGRVSGVTDWTAHGGGQPATASVAGVASTVVDLRPLALGRGPVVLREGVVPASDVLAAIRRLV